ncbi:MAG: sigma-B regulation protein RsbU (phosphoserine phosphatase) [Glaciecola sp.]|jgi:sigma-B regulation protein RsbU (phosphoserine phosphatase)|uniref:SpoIIE family protein phosphatase n=1 Tax=Congregibacter sp. TaxID=2744308 RepID=UPI0039E2AFF5
MAYSGKVLVIDDDLNRGSNLADLASTAGFTASVERSLDSFNASLGEGSDWDVVLCDVQATPKAWAAEGASLRELNIQVPVMMFSNEPRSASMMRALRLGANDFFATPVEDSEALLASIERCVRLRTMSRELRRSRQDLEAANRELKNTVRVLEKDQQAGRQVQMRMLPTSPMVVSDYMFSHTIIPSLYLSGDFTDYFTVDDHYVVFFMADVSGHGSSSAFATVLLKNLFARKRSDYLRRSDNTILGPVAMLTLANRELLELDVGKYATMVVGVLDQLENSLQYSVAGHLPLPVLVSDAGAKYLEGEGNAVGMMPDARYNEYSLDLPEAFMLALFSDGILEILPPKNLIEKEAFFLDVFSRTADTPDELVSQLGLDTAETAPDDIAALFVSKRVSGE